MDAVEHRAENHPDHKPQAGEDNAAQHVSADPGPAEVERYPAVNRDDSIAPRTPPEGAGS